MPTDTSAEAKRMRLIAYLRDTKRGTTVYDGDPAIVELIQAEALPSFAYSAKRNFATKEVELICNGCGCLWRIGVWNYQYNAYGGDGTKT